MRVLRFGNLPSMWSHANRREPVYQGVSFVSGPLHVRLAQALRRIQQLPFADHHFFPEASLRRCLLLIALFSPAIWLPTTTCPTPQARGDGTSNIRPTTWRRTKLGWEETSHWQIDVPVRFPTPATAVHPLVIASLELMISVGALAASTRKRRR